MELKEKKSKIYLRLKKKKKKKNYKISKLGLVGSTSVTIANPKD